MGFEEVMQLKILNSIVLLYLAINGFFVIYNTFVTEFYDVVILQCSFFLCTLFVLYFISKNKYNTSKFIIFFLLNVQVFITSMFLLPGRGAEYFYLLIILLFLIVSNNRQLLYLIIALDICLFFSPQFFIHAYPDAHYSYINIIALIVTMAISLQYFIVIQNSYKELLKAQKQKLEKLNEEKNDLMSIVAHDLKTPLAQIKGLISIFELEETELSKNQKQLLDRIKRVAEDHNDQIIKYLKAQSIEESIDGSNMHEVDVWQMMNQVHNEMLPLANVKNIKLIETFDTKNIAIEGSSEGLYKILSNLVSNAIKYSQKNTQVRVDIRSDQKQVLIAVSDQGPGFSEDDMNNVFKKHKVLSAKPTNDESATGLGLYIVKRYVDKMSGWIWLESKEGEGSTFYIKLPRV